MENGSIEIQGKRYDLREHTPLLRPSWAALMKRMREHPAAPYWNSHYGDRLTGEDLEKVQRFHDALYRLRSPAPYAEEKPPEHVVENMKRLIPLVPLFRKRVPGGLDMEREWRRVPFTVREDLARTPELLVPDDADISRLVIFATAGTTGHALRVPQHPSGACSYEPMLDLVFRKYGLVPRWNDGMTATVLVGAQAFTVTCATVMTSWQGAGFIKINLKESEWPSERAPHEYMDAMEPFFINGDPISLARMAEMGISYRPSAIVTTAVAMTDGLRKKLEDTYGCPVIDWYSSNETGPIGYSCRENSGFHILPHDIHVEIIGPQGEPVPQGEHGEITVTGGRNPFFPMLRYRTGDFGALDMTPCRCGDPMPRIVRFQGRVPVLFRGERGNTVNPVDISQVLKRFSYVQHRFSQAGDLSCRLVIKPVSMMELPDPVALRSALEKLLGAVPLEITFDPDLGNDSSGGKVMPFVSDFRLE